MSGTSTPHPDPARLAAFAAGLLSGDEATAIEHHLAGCTTCAEALEQAPPDTLGALLRGEAAEGAPAHPPAADAGPARHGRFTIRQFHAGGGLGDVYVACDEELGREVALKGLKGEHRD